MDREVIRCQVCGLVQYRTRTGNCRRCLRLLPPKVTFVIPTPSPQDLPGDDRQLFENWPNRETVENIGQRIRQLRESRGMTQSQLQARSRVSRSYLSRIESGQMTPSLGTLEKIAEASGCRPESLLRSGIERRNGSRGPVHSGPQAVPAPARLGAVAVHSEEVAGHQRPRQHELRAGATATSCRASNRPDFTDAPATPSGSSRNGDSQVAKRPRRRGPGKSIGPESPRQAPGPFFVHSVPPASLPAPFERMRR